MSVRIPGAYGNMAGWFRSIYLNALGVIDSDKIWVELSDGNVVIRDGPKNGVVKRVIPCAMIEDVEEIDYDQLEITIPAIKLKVKKVVDAETELMIEELIWGWGSDKSMNKKKWRKALIATHGSGIEDVSAKKVRVLAPASATQSTKVKLQDSSI